MKWMQISHRGYDENWLLSEAHRDSDMRNLDSSSCTVCKDIPDWSFHTAASAEPAGVNAQGISGSHTEGRVEMELVPSQVCYRAIRNVCSRLRGSYLLASRLDQQTYQIAAFHHRRAYDSSHKSADRSKRWFAFHDLKNKYDGQRSFGIWILME